MFWRLPCTVSLVCLLSLTLGCGGDGANRVSGKVTFKGQPVPAGKVYFTPDGSKGNQGPSGYADIKDGTYDTASAGGRGSMAGAVVIGVEGVDPSAPPDKAAPDVTAKLLFPRYELKAELTAGANTKDIEVPAEAVKGMAPPKPTGIVP